MKAILCFALLLAVCSAAFNPTWKTVNPYANTWKAAGVYAQSNARAGYNNVVTVCGNANYDTTVSAYSYSIGRLNQVWYQGVVGVPPQNLFQGSGYCFYFNYQVPTVASPYYTLNLTLQNPSVALTTVQIDWNIQ